jgi:hypothetical protein
VSARAALLRARAVARFELRWQAHDMMTWVYAGVLFGLPFAFTGTTAVDLVGERGPVPRTAAWALAHALAGVTAFGQVITTFVAAGAALRDDALRTRDLVAATRLTRLEYLAGRYAGVTATMVLLYLALPLGAWLGARMPWAPDGAFPAGRALWPWAVLVLPNALLVSALFFAAGALVGTLVPILLLGVVLVGLWQAGVALAQDPATAWWGALLDPFGNGALTAVTGGWDAARRGAAAVPWTATPLVANRALWLGVAALAAGWTLARWDFRRAAPRRAPRPPNARAPAVPAVGGGTGGTGGAVAAPASPPRAPAQVAEFARFTLREIAADRLYLALLALGALNAGFGGWRAARGSVPPDPAAATERALGFVAAHGRVFALLVAAVWAGELVWRERDLRADAVRDVLPARTASAVAGKLTALGLALLPMALALVAAAGVVATLRGMPWAWGDALRWGVATAWPALARLALVATALHALVQQKVAGHFALVLLWLVVVALGAATGVDAARWLDPLPVTDAPPAWAALPVAAAAGVVARVRWRRGRLPAGG